MVRITLIILSFLIGLQFTLNHQLPITLSYFYGAINLLTFYIYYLDKIAARKGHWRIKETQLHLLSLLGGWWGALIAQQFLRHKSIEKSFLVVFSFTLLVNVSALALFLYKGK
ncbi:DUF1294 domain-containing protein [Psychromonas hadalis]|uniref:DUF1294 domain-containing protein n=1 Tax=Psychromonas hadalis TaxID=211669 RepID=UPI0003B3F38E|nr:DUF1294 domain-containing protein [Psychromonas hadalis]